MNQEKTGIQAKYIVSHTDGTPLDKGAFYWLLRIDAGGDPIHIAACRKAWRVYADEIKATLPLLAEDIYQKLRWYEKLDTVISLTEQFQELTNRTQKQFPVKPPTELRDGYEHRVPHKIV